MIRQKHNVAGFIFSLITVIFVMTPIAMAAAPESHVLMATQVLKSKQMMSSQAKSCAEYYAEKGVTFRFIQFFWEGDYFEVLQGADLVIATLPTAERAERYQALLEQDKQLRAATSKRSALEWDYKCRNLYESLVDKNRHMDSFDKEIQKRMSEVYAHSGAPSFARRDNDFTIGCMKAQYNRGLRDFDTVKRECSCMTETVTNLATPEQLTALETRPETVRSQPWLLRLAPKLNACLSHRGSNSD